MCVGQPKIKKPDTPPPPAPVLQQSAPKSAAAKPDAAVRRAGGTKQYRTNPKLSIGGVDNAKSGLGISG